MALFLTARRTANLKLQTVAAVASLALALALLQATSCGRRWPLRSLPDSPAASIDNPPSSIRWDHALFSQVQRDLQEFNHSGITLTHIEQAYCRGSRASIRVQVVEGRVYIAGETPSFQSRMSSIKRQLLNLWLAGGMPDGFDFVIEAEDGPTVGGTNEECPSRGPLIGAAKVPSDPSHSHVVLAPDHTFAGWPEAHTLPWNEMLPLLQHAALKQPWEQRSDLLFFRGAKTGTRYFLAPDLSNMYPDVLDVRLVDWSTAGFVSLTEHCRYKYLLHVPGNTYSGRLKYLLACGSAVVVSNSPWTEFWSHLARAGEHFMLADEVTGDNRGNQFANATAVLQRDQGLARRLGQAATQLVQDSLSPTMVQAYWRHLMHSYRSLQQYNATLHADAVPLELSILRAQVIDVSQRTCLKCKQ